MPRRAVAVEFVEPADFPRHAERLVINRFLEDFYNANARPGTYVAYAFWEKGGVRELPEPIQAGIPLQPHQGARSTPEDSGRLRGNRMLPHHLTQSGKGSKSLYRLKRCFPQILSSRTFK
jgi:hypothetical protein